MSYKPGTLVECLGAAGGQVRYIARLTSSERFGHVTGVVVERRSSTILKIGTHVNIPVSGIRPLAAPDKRPAGMRELDERFARRAAAKAGSASQEVSDLRERLAQLDRQCDELRRYGAAEHERAIEAEARLDAARCNTRDAQQQVVAMREELARVRRENNALRGAALGGQRDAGVPRKVLIVLTPPGVEPSENGPLSAMAEADLVIAGAVDDSYVKVLKNRYDHQDAVEVNILWER